MKLSHIAGLITLSLSSYSYADDYTISSSEIDSRTPIDRNFYDAFDLDDIKSEVFDANKIKLTNNTPRTLYQPVVSVDGVYYLIDSNVEPFSVVTIISSLSTISTVSFVNEAPFFKAHIREYAQTQVGDIWGTVDENMADKYNITISGWKYIDNRFDTNVQFINWYDERYVWDDETRVENLISRLNFQEDSTYYRLQNTSASGMATVGNGKLGIYSVGLGDPEVDTTPKSFYYHEKMHNHGYNHESGMTYGWSDFIADYIKDDMQVDFFEKANEVDKDKFYSQATFDTSQSDKLTLRIKWGTKNDLLNELTNFIVVSNNTDIQWVGYEENGTVLYYTPPSQNLLNRVHVYNQNHLEIPMSKIDNFNDSSQYLIIETDTPIYPSSFFINSATDSSGDHSGSVIIEYPSSLGYKNELYNATLFLDKSSGVYKSYTPSEASSYCESKGLALGILPSLSSSEMFQLQDDYNFDGSQVGLSYETGEPIAYSVNAKSEINEVSKGSLIVCSI